LQLIKDSLDLYHHRHGGIHLVVIDGIADLIRSANDEAESIAVVDELYRLAGTSARSYNAKPRASCPSRRTTIPNTRS